MISGGALERVAQWRAPAQQWRRGATPCQLIGRFDDVHSFQTNPTPKNPNEPSGANGPGNANTPADRRNPAERTNPGSGVNRTNPADQTNPAGPTAPRSEPAHKRRAGPNQPSGTNESTRCMQTTQPSASKRIHERLNPNEPGARIGTNPARGDPNKPNVVGSERRAHRGDRLADAGGGRSTRLGHQMRGLGCDAPTGS
jgi:hypothetical protein